MSIFIPPYIFILDKNMISKKPFQVNNLNQILRIGTKKAVRMFPLSQLDILFN